MFIYILGVRKQINQVLDYRLKPEQRCRMQLFYNIHSTCI